MEIKEMNLEQLSEQKEEIRSMLNNEDADLDALTARLDEIDVLITMSFFAETRTIDDRRVLVRCRWFPLVVPNRFEAIRCSL